MPKRVQVWGTVSEEVAEVLTRLAAAKRTTRNALVGELVERALEAHGERSAELLVVPMLEETIRHEVRHEFRSVRRLLVRLGLEAGTTRQLLQYLMKASFKNEALVEQKGEEFWKKSVLSLRAPMQDVDGLVEASEREALEGRP